MKNHYLSKNVRALTTTAILSAIGFVLMIAEFSLPVIIPEFIKFDLSDLPSLIASFAYGPIWGVAVCLLKNVLHLPLSSSGGVGELCNFILGAMFVLPAGLIYKKHKNRKGALLGSLIGAILMSVIGVVINYFIVYPFYTKFMPMETIIGMYKAILPRANTLLKALLIFNLPFTFIKAMSSVLITFLIYKKIRPILKKK